MHFNFHEKYFVDDEVDNYTNSSNKNQRNMDRTSLADSIETGLNHLGNLLSRWNYSMPQFRERQTTKETDLDDQSTKEKSNEVSDDEPTEQNTQGQADKSIFFIFIYWPITADKNNSHMLFLFFFISFHLYLLADKNNSHMFFSFFYFYRIREDVADMNLSTLKIGSRAKKNENKENENKENENKDTNKKWYEGQLCRPVAFRATARRRHTHN